jgi:hypothetical protein
MKRIYLFFYFSFIISSCANDEDKSHFRDLEEVKLTNNTIDLVLIDSVTFPISKYTDPVQSSGKMLSMENDNYYYYFNDNNNSIEFMKVDSPKTDLVVSLNKEGPNSVSSIKDIFAVTLDSIFVISGAGNRKIVTLINGKGNNIDTWNLDNYLPSKYESYWLTDFDCYKFAYDNNRNTMYFYLYNGYIIEQSTQITFEQFAFNIVDESYTIFGILPNEFSEKSFYPYFGICSEILPNYIINYFPSLPYTIIYEKDSLENKNLISSTSKFITQLDIAEDEIGNDPNSSLERKFLMESDAYLKTLTNKDGSLIYRFLKLGQPSLTVDNKPLDFMDMNFSVQIFNSKFKFLAEFDFSDFDDLYFPFSFAIDQKLYISTNNPISKTFDENNYKFYIYEVGNNTASIN